MILLQTARLRLRHLGDGDEPFIVELLNDPSFLRNIGDRDVRTLADASRYIHEGPMASYERYGFGLYLVERKDDAASIGICGLLERESLDDVDIGFAFLPGYRAQGYAHESAEAVITHARETLKLIRVVAIVSPDNASSITLLGKLGMRFERMIRLDDDSAELALYAREL